MKMEADVVIVGTGVGGLFSALSLPRDQKIIMITKSDLESSDSFLAQGGICMLHDKDDYDSYFEDTMKAGHYENRKESVDLMIRSSREIIHDLIGYGVDFQKQETDESGNEAADNGGEKAEIQDIYAFTREGAHSRPRILFHADITGKEITSKLLAQVKQLSNVRLLEYTMMTDIIVENDECKGIIAQDKDGNEFEIHTENTIWQAVESVDVISILQISRISQEMHLQFLKNTESVWSIWTMYRSIQQHCIPRNQEDAFLFQSLSVEKVRFFLTARKNVL